MAVGTAAARERPTVGTGRTGGRHLPLGRAGCLLGLVGLGLLGHGLGLRGSNLCRHSSHLRAGRRRLHYIAAEHGLRGLARCANVCYGTAVLVRTYGTIA